MPVTWLHVSDFHFKGTVTYDNDVVLRSLVESVEWFRSQGRTADLIFATGDVGYSGKADDYAHVGAFFDALIKAAGIDKRRLFVIPGNHDSAEDVGFARTLESLNDAETYFSSTGNKPHIEKKQRAFADWYNSYFAGIRSFPENTTCGPVERYDGKECSIGILPLNSALFCLGKNDHRKLWLGRQPLERAIGELMALQADLNVAMIHHPLDWLHHLEMANIRTILTKAVDVILRGHLHESDAESTERTSGSVLHLAAGATYLTREYPRRALYVTVDKGQATVFPIMCAEGAETVWVHDTAQFPRLPGGVGVFPLSKCGGLSTPIPLPPRDETEEKDSATDDASRSIDSSERFESLKQEIRIALDLFKDVAAQLETLLPKPEKRDNSSLVDRLINLDFNFGKSILLKMYKSLNAVGNTTGVAAITKVSRLLIPWLYVASKRMDLGSWEKVSLGGLLLVPAGSTTFAEIVMAGIDRREVSWGVGTDPDRFPPGAFSRTIPQPESGITDKTEDNLRDDLFRMVKAPTDITYLDNKAKDDAISRQLKYWLMDKGIRVYVTLLIPQNATERKQYEAMVSRIRQRYPFLAVVDLDWGLRGIHQDIFNEIRPLLL